MSECQINMYYNNNLHLYTLRQDVKIHKKDPIIMTPHINVNESSR